MKIAFRDQVTMFEQSLVFYRNRPVFIESLDEVDQELATVFDLKDQEYKTVNWDVEKVAAPARRLGMVNTVHGAVYVTRIPIRRYTVGLKATPDTTNIQIDKLNSEYSAGTIELSSAIKSLKDKGLYNSLLNKYPTFDEAKKRVRKNAIIVAFDKQFAIDAANRIFYKNMLVGYSHRTGIEFNGEFEHLKSLMPKDVKCF